MSMNLKDWANKNLATHKDVSLDKCKVTQQNKNGTVKIVADGCWVNMASPEAIKDAIAKNSLSIEFVKRPDWQRANWITTYDLAKLQEEDNNGTC